MSIIAQAPVQFASFIAATGTSAQQFQVNAAGVAAGLTAGNFVLGIPAEYSVGYVPVTVKAQGYIALGVTSTVTIGMLAGATQATATTATYTGVASASLTGANPPVQPTNYFPFSVEQKVLFDAASQKAVVFGPGSGYQLTAGSALASIYVGAAGVNIAAGYPTTISSLTYNPTSQPTPQNGINNVVTTVNNVLYFGLSVTFASSQTTANTAVNLVSFYAVAD